MDAFADRVFAGAPAAVCTLEAWLPDETLRAIAAENNLPETAFLVQDGGDWAIRWFTPTVEVELCGHATLASAHVVLHHLEPSREAVTFRSASGLLAVARGESGLLVMRLPRRAPVPAETHEELLRALGRAPLETWRARDYVAVLASEEEVRSLAPDLGAVTRLPGDGLVVTAPGTGEVDFVSRCFSPQTGIPEDPVTGAAHCTLVPLWAAKLGKRKLAAEQVSRRGGRLACEDRDDAVLVSGRTAEYLAGAISVPR